MCRGLFRCAWDGTNGTGGISVYRWAPRVISSPMLVFIPSPTRCPRRDLTIPSSSALLRSANRLGHRCWLHEAAAGSSSVRGFRAPFPHPVPSRTGAFVAKCGAARWYCGAMVEKQMRCWFPSHAHRPGWRVRGCGGTLVGVLIPHSLFVPDRRTTTGHHILNRRGVRVHPGNPDTNPRVQVPLPQGISGVRHTLKASLSLERTGTG